MEGLQKKTWISQENAPAGSEVSSRVSNLRLEGQKNKVPAAARNQMREAKTHKAEKVQKRK